MANLNEKQKAFCEEYIKDFNGTQAAIRAGYSSHTANEQASQLLAKLNVQEYLEELKAERAKRVRLDHDYVLNTLIEVVDRCKQATPVMIRDEDGKYVESGEWKFESTSVIKAIDLIGKHLGTWEKDNIQKAPVINIKTSEEDDGIGE